MGNPRRLGDFSAEGWSGKGLDPKGKAFLQQILDLHDFQGDALQPEDFLEEDEYHATTETVISMAQESKWAAG